MNDTVFEFNKSASIAHSSLTTRAKFIASTFAIVISRHLPVPSENNSVAEDFYNINCVPIVNEVISTLNETFVMDARLCGEYTRRWWMIRANAVCPKPINTLSAQYGIVDTYVGAGEVWSKADHEFINEVKDGMLVCSNKAFKVLNELFAQYFPN